MRRALPGIKPQNQNAGGSGVRCKAEDFLDSARCDVLKDISYSGALDPAPTAARQDGQESHNEEDKELNFSNMFRSGRSV